MDLIILIMAALICAVIAWRQTDWMMEVRLLLVLAAVVFLALAIAAALAWMQLNAAIIEEQRQRAYACSERVRLVMELRYLNPEQLAALGKYTQVIETLSHDADVTPIPCWPLMGGGKTTKAFIQRFIGMGDERDLPAIRALDDDDVDQARQVIADFVQRGWVRPARGNQPAQWISRDSAINQIFGGET